MSASDLLNDPSRRGCACGFCAKHPQSWTTGPIMEHFTWRAATLSRERRLAQNHLTRLVATTYTDMGLELPDHLARKDAA